MGLIVLGCVGLTILVSVVSIKVYPPPAHSQMGFLRFGSFLLATVVVGWELYRLKKWAALVFSVFSLSLGVWMAKLAMQEVPGRNNKVGFVFAALLTIATILTIMYWHALLWTSQPSARPRG